MSDTGTPGGIGPANTALPRDAGVPQAQPVVSAPSVDSGGYCYAKPVGGIGNNDVNKAR